MLSVVSAKFFIRFVDDNGVNDVNGVNGVNGVNDVNDVAVDSNDDG